MEPDGIWFIRFRSRRNDGLLHVVDLMTDTVVGRRRKRSLMG